MPIENELKALILSRYKSVRDFSISIDMPYSTIDSIFKRGVGNASVTNIIKICETLSISADDLARGVIVFRAPVVDSSDPRESRLLESFRSFNAEGQDKLLSYASDLESTGQYKKADTNIVVERNA